MTNKFVIGWSKRIPREYGTTIGWLKCHLFAMLYRLGGLQLTDIDWTRIHRLVFVCKGNICRSPYAEAKARSLGINAISCGLEADGQSPVAPQTLRHAMRRGLDLSQHCSKRLHNIDVTAHDLLVGMEPYHLEALHKLSRGCEAQITLLGLWGEKPQPYLQDPLGLSDEYYHTCFDNIDNSVLGITCLLSIPNKGG